MMSRSAVAAAAAAAAAVGAAGAGAAAAVEDGGREGRSSVDCCGRWWLRAAATASDGVRPTDEPRPPGSGTRSVDTVHLRSRRPWRWRRQPHRCTAPRKLSIAKSEKRQMNEWRKEKKGSRLRQWEEVWGGGARGRGQRHGFLNS